MTSFVVAVGIFGVFAATVLKLAARDLRQRNGLSGLTSASIWLLYVFHADTVVAAAFGDLARLDVPSGPFLIGGLVLAGAGWLLFVAATVSLVRHGSFEGLETTRLVVTGSFRVSRHPQTVGWALLLLGTAIASRSAIALALVAVFAVFADRFARLEDRHLFRRFGTPYVSYKEHTPVLPAWPPSWRSSSRRARPKRVWPARPRAARPGSDEVS